MTDIIFVDKDGERRVLLKNVSPAARTKVRAGMRCLLQAAMKKAGESASWLKTVELLTKATVAATVTDPIKKATMQAMKLWAEFLFEFATMDRDESRKEFHRLADRGLCDMLETSDDDDDDEPAPKAPKAPKAEPKAPKAAPKKELRVIDGVSFWLTPATGATDAKRKYKCATCVELGHISRRCPSA